MRFSFPRSAITLPLVAAAVACLLFAQTFNANWAGHLQTDVIIHHQQALQYAATGSWSNISFNEYQPGALWFFLTPHLLASWQDNWDAYRTGTLFLNGLLLLAHLALFKRFGPASAPWVFLALAAAAGPILLYRFDLLVSLLVLISWLLVYHHLWSWSAFVLGVATATKLYPIVVLPLVLLEAWRTRQWGTLARLLGCFAAGVAIVVVPFLLFGGSLAGIATSFDKYAVKPVGLDSLWGSALTLGWQVFAATLPVLDSANGIHGIAPASALVPLRWYDLAWVVPVGIFLATLAGTTKRIDARDALLPVIVLTLFTLSAKVINPQYLWWFVSLLPLVSLKHWPAWHQAALISTALLSLVLTQLVYPLHYNEFLDWFYGRSPSSGLFIISLIRNGLLLGFLALLVTDRRPV
jgi:hypothetical protein